jgi:hypothetical protein
MPSDEEAPFGWEIPVPSRDDRRYEEPMTSEGGLATEGPPTHSRGHVQG